MPHELIFKDIENKSVEDLQAILADNELLYSDDDSVDNLIIAVTEAIIKKENKTPSQREKERADFWTSFLDRYGDVVPIRLDDVLK